MSFIPFNFGERKCLGQMFAELVVPNIVINMMDNFEFEFVDQKWMEEGKYPVATTGCSIKHPLSVIIKPN